VVERIKAAKEEVEDATQGIDVNGVSVSIIDRL